jgi:hypothetical protein
MRERERERERERQRQRDACKYVMQNGQQLFVL